jgi:2-methylaconitate cis-trans-isomerase PrpF
MASTVPQTRKRTRHRHQLPASLMRAGTSRGLFIHQKYLPESQQAWKPWILAAMGSKNNDARQIDGVGGATSTTSKVCVVAPSTRPGIDVEYTFIQVAVGKESLDFSGNCGNMASGIGPFAVEEGLVRATPGESHIDVSIYNTNTGKKLVETVELDDEGHYYDEGDYMMPGVRTPGSEVKVAFVDPAGSMTGKLFPTGKCSEMLQVAAPRNGVVPFEVQASFVDAANPFVIVDATTMPLGADAALPGYLDLVEDIRRSGAVQMGLAPSVEAAALVKGTPKLAYF